MHNDFITNLRWRGMIHDMTPGLEKALNKGMMTAYLGFDPTATSLHVGNLAAIMLLQHFQQAGHKPIAVVGGATGMVGDPSFKAAERKFLDQATLLHNQACIHKQLTKFLDFTPKANTAELVNNIDWLQPIGMLDFLREAGKHITVNYMLAKDSVKRRLDSGISFTEFSYQLLQGYDFYHLYTTKGVHLQIGGADQWGNLTTGIELIRRKTGKEAFALTIPLITRADGSKFSKSEQGNIWLDPTLTSPYEFYQFWLNFSDEDAQRLIKVFTHLSKETIEALIEEHDPAPHKRLLQKALAKEVTILVHSTEAYQQAQRAAELLFGRQSITSLNEQDLTLVLQNIPKIPLSQSQFEKLQYVIDLVGLTDVDTMFTTKAAMRRTIQEGGMSINGEKITDPQQAITTNLLHGKYLLIQRGRKQHYLMEVI